VTSQLSRLDRAHQFLGSEDELAVALAFNYKDAGSIGGNALGDSRRVLTLHVHELGVGWHCVHQQPFFIFILFYFYFFGWHCVHQQPAPLVSRACACVIEREIRESGGVQGICVCARIPVFVFYPRDA
jgi:hypothetical protein